MTQTTLGRYNLKSPNQIRTPCNLKNLAAWAEAEAQSIRERTVLKVVRQILKDLDAFIRWPQKALLLWEGRTRKDRYHRFPPEIKLLAQEHALRLDTRQNGPAIASYMLAGGARPNRFGSQNKWNVHHLYSGKFPYAGHSTTIHAVKDGKHFSQSSGLIAVHPIADQMCDEFPFFSWLLRAQAFLRFGYDPDGVFCTPAGYGFRPGAAMTVYYKSP